MATMWWIRLWFVGLVSITLTRAANSKQKSKTTSAPTHFRANVGRFSIPISDNRLPDPKINRTLQDHLTDLTNASFNYWWNETSTVLSIEDAIPILTSLANQTLNPDEFAKYNLPLLQLANQTFNTDTQFLLTNGCSNYLNASPTATYAEQIFLPRCFDEADLEYFFEIDPGNLINNISAVNIFENGTFFDLISEYTQAVYNTSIATQFYNYAALMGVGWNVDCSDQITDVLASKDEWANAGSNAATTLMALLPTFLAFGNLYVPRSSEVFSTSALVGLGASLYSFGLPVQSLSVIPNRQNLVLSTFGIATLAMIASFAVIDDKKNVRKPSEKLTKHNRPMLTDLQTWSNEKDECITSMDEARNNFAQIKEDVIKKCVNRWDWYYLPTIFVAASQGIMFGLAIVPLLADIGAPRFIFTCTTNWTGLYLAITAGVNAIFRFIMWEMGNHERVLVYPLSRVNQNGEIKISEAEEELKKVIVNAESSANLIKPLNSMETELPPLYPPLLSLIWSTIDRYNLKYNPFADASENNEARYAVHLRQYETKYHAIWIVRAYKIARHGIERTCMKHWHHFKYLFTSVTTLQLFRHWGRNDDALSRRYKPLVILIHLSTSGRNFAMILFTGFIEAFLLLFLTFFLASQWGGNLVITGFALALLLLFITAGRALGLFYTWLTTRIWGLTAINCDSQDEILGSLRIICSMQGVLVHVNGAFYYDGISLLGLPEFENWEDKYYAGTYDNDGKGAEKMSPTISDLELGTEMTHFPGTVTSPQVEHEVPTRNEVYRRRQPFERTPTTQTESREPLVPPHPHGRQGYGASTNDVNNRANSLVSQSSE